VRFLVDAQIPRRLAHHLRAAGHDTLHTLDLPDANRTSDAELARRAEREQRVVVTKDADFVSSFLIHRRPPALLLISTGNIGNAELQALVSAALPQIVEAFAQATFVELTRDSIVVHQ
jgi:predicted nuclease of predicted toxin-antitoxin system